MCSLMPRIAKRSQAEGDKGVGWLRAAKIHPWCVGRSAAAAAPSGRTSPRGRVVRDCERYRLGPVTDDPPGIGRRGRAGRAADRTWRTGPLPFADGPRHRIPGGRRRQEKPEPRPGSRVVVVRPGNIRHGRNGESTRVGRRSNRRVMRLACRSLPGSRRSPSRVTGVSMRSNPEAASRKRRSSDDTEAG
jgi:hypothetical protein